MTLFTHVHNGVVIPYDDECPVCESDEVSCPVIPANTVMHDDDIVNRFTYHAPKPGQPQIYEAIRRNAGGFAQLIRDTTPGCQEQSLAITHLEEAVFWANAAIARNS